VSETVAVEMDLARCDECGHHALMHQEGGTYHCRYFQCSCKASMGEVLAPSVSARVKAARAEAWDEGQRAVTKDYMAGYDAQLAGEPCPHPTPNPYRALASPVSSPAPDAEGPDRTP